MGGKTIKGPKISHFLFNLIYLNKFKIGRNFN